ncbi:DUF6673 family protein [Oscillospiraceae bacterium NTUH-002-81]|nr:DUF6673 family protein [Oscillospiraceae bacterium NTUH-002-81]
MVINGKELNFKISNLKDAGNMELALKEMEKTEKEVRKGKDLSTSSAIQAMIDMFRNFFKMATGVDVLEGCEDALDAKQAYSDFLKEISKQKQAILEPFSLDRIK